MSRIFLALALLTSLFGPNSCAKNTVDEVSLPKDVEMATASFLAAVKRGDQAEAERYMAPAFIDDSRVQFDEMSAILKKAPPLVTALYVPKPEAFGPNDNEISVTYAANNGKKWISSEIRLYRQKGGKFEIEYWDVKSEANPPPLLAHAKAMRIFMNWLLGGIAVSALLGLALLIWVVKRRTHIIAPDPQVENRRIAATVRDAD